MIYLDNGATTFPKPLSVVKAMDNALINYGANPGRSGHNLSMKASMEIYNCRENIRELFNAKSAENIIFTNNCTASLNIIIKGLLKSGDHVVVTCLEHNSVMRPLKHLEKIGVTFTEAEVFPGNNQLTIDSFRNAINENTKLVVCNHASNVFGIKIPVGRITALCHQYGIPVCVDAAQSAGIVDIDVQEWGIDYLCAAGHKGLYGPMGMGILIINSDVLPDSLVQGGTGSNSSMFEQPEILPDKYESGTPNLVGIVGLNAGVNFLKNKTIKTIAEHEMKLIEYLYDNLEKINKVKLFTQKPTLEYFVPVLSFAIDGTNSEDVALFLNNKYNIAVRAGLHCAPSAHKYMNTIDEGTVRICPSIFTTQYQIDMLLRAIRDISSK